jgi:hypothetical protein
MPYHEDEKRQVNFGVTDYGDIVGLSEEIRTYNEQIEDGGDLSALRDEIAKAQRIIFLGFHFHSQNMDLLTPPHPARTVQIFATAKDRSVAELAIIDRQIRAMLAAQGGNWIVTIERNLDCKGLFKDYGTTWLS